MTEMTIDDLRWRRTAASQKALIWQ